MTRKINLFKTLCGDVMLIECGRRF